MRQKTSTNATKDQRLEQFRTALEDEGFTILNNVKYQVRKRPRARPPENQPVYIHMTAAFKDEDEPIAVAAVDYDRYGHERYSSVMSDKWSSSLGRQLSQVYYIPNKEDAVAPRPNENTCLLDHRPAVEALEAPINTDLIQHLRQIHAFEAVFGEDDTKTAVEPGFPDTTMMARHDTREESPASVAYKLRYRPHRTNDLTLTIRYPQNASLEWIREQETAFVDAVAVLAQDVQLTVKDPLGTIETRMQADRIENPSSLWEEFVNASINTDYDTSSLTVSLPVEGGDEDLFRDARDKLRPLEDAFTSSGSPTPEGGTE